MTKEIKIIGDNVDYDNYLLQVVTKKVYGFKNSKTLEKLIKGLHNRNMTIDKAEIKQNEFAEKHNDLRGFLAKASKYIDLKKSVSKNVKNFCDGWEKIVYAFKKGILPLSKKDDMKTDSGDQQPDISDNRRQIKFNNFLE